MEGIISADYLPQRLSTVFQYHELHHLESRQKNVFRALVRAYHCHMDVVRTTPSSTGIGFPAHLMREIVQLGFSTGDQTTLSSFAMAIMAFFQVRTVSMPHVQCTDIIFDNATLEVYFYRHNGKSIRRPLVLRYRASNNWSPIDNTLQLILGWHSDKNQDGSFGMSLSDSLEHLLSRLKNTQPENCHYLGHRPQIWGTMSFRSLISPKNGSCRGCGGKRRRWCVSFMAGVSLRLPILVGFWLTFCEQLRLL